VKLFWYIFFLCFGANCAGAAVYDITDYGAKGNGQTINTKFIQAAIDKCSAAGGGTVKIPAGTFLSGTIFLKSHIELHLEMGAVLKGSSQLDDYRHNGTIYGLIFSEDTEDISLTGDGEINGNSSHFMFPDKLHTFVDYDPLLTRQGKAFMHNFAGVEDGPIAYGKRPDMMIVIKHSSQVRLSSLRMTDAPNWTIRIGECENVTITNLTILNSRLIPNNDGIHCTTSRNVIISNCTISTGDDGIVITGFGDETGVGGYTETVTSKTFRFGNKTHEARNVTVSNCIIASSSAAIRIGYGRNNIRNCLFDNICIHDSNRGILIQCRDNNKIQHLIFSHIIIDTRLFTGSWWGKGEPIHISALPQTGTIKVGKIIDVNFFDIRIIHAEAGILLFGNDKESAIEDVSFKDMLLTIGNGPQSENFGGNFDLRPANASSLSIFKHSIPAIYGFNVKDIRLENVKVVWEKSVQPYFTSALNFKEFEGLQIKGFEGRQGQKSSPVIDLENGKNIRILESVVLPPQARFLTKKNCRD